MAQVKRCEKCEEFGLTVRVWPGDRVHTGRSSSVERICVGCLSLPGSTRDQRRLLMRRIRRDDHRDDVEAIGLGLLDALTGEIVVAPACNV